MIHNRNDFNQISISLAVLQLGSHHCKVASEDRHLRAAVMRPRGLMTLAARGMLMAVVSVAVTAAIGAAAAAALAQCPPGLRAALAASAVLAEVAFAAYYWLLHARRLGCRITTSPADICPISIRDKMLHAIKHEDPRQMLIGWFRGCERFEDIHRCAYLCPTNALRTDHLGRSHRSCCSEQREQSCWAVRALFGTPSLLTSQHTRVCPPPVVEVFAANHPLYCAEQ